MLAFGFLGEIQQMIPATAPDLALPLAPDAATHRAAEAPDP
jgi:hypothetical protein